MSMEDRAPNGINEYPTYSESAYTVRGNLAQQHTCWYSECVIENLTSETLVMLDLTGEQYEIPPRFKDSYMSSGRVDIHRLVKLGVPQMYNRPGGVTTTGDYKVIKNSVTEATLRGTPVYLPKFGIAIAKKEYADKLRSIHPSFNTDLRTAAIRSVRSEIRNRGAFILELIACSPNSDTDTLYLGMNGTISEITVQKSQFIPPFARLLYNKDGAIAESEIPIKDAFADCSVVTIHRGLSILLGTDRGKIASTMDNMEQKRKSLKTPEEVAIVLRDSAVELQAENDNLKRERAGLKEELRLVGKDHSNTKDELEILSTNLRQTHEEQVLSIKYDKEKLDLEAKIQQAKFAEDKAKLDMAHTLQMNLATARKEALAANTAESTNVAAVVKASAVVLPIAVSAAVYMANISKPDKGVGLLSALSAATSIPIVVGAALAVSALSSVGFNPLDHALDISSRVWEVGKSFMRSVSNAMCEGFSGAIRGIASFFT